MLVVCLIAIAGFGMLFGFDRYRHRFAQIYVQSRHTQFLKHQLDTDAAAQMIHRIVLGGYVVVALSVIAGLLTL